MTFNFFNKPITIGSVQEVLTTPFDFGYLKLGLNGGIIPPIIRILKEWRGSSPLTCAGTVANPFKEVKAYGNSVQSSRLSKNLSNDKNIVDEYNATDNYLFKGYFRTTYNSYTSHNKYCVAHLILPAGTYTITPQCSNPYILRYSIGSTVTSLTETTVSLTITLTEEAEFQVNWRNASVTDLDSSDIMIEEGTQATGYEEYGATITTPTTSSPIEIKSVGDKTKNLFDINSSGVQWGRNINQNGTKSISTINSSSGFIEANTNTDYTVSFINKVASSITRYHLYDENKNWIKQIATFSIAETLTPVGDRVQVIFNSENAKYIRFTFKGVSKTDVTLSGNIQLEQGNTATEYEKFGYKAPVEVSGKNLFDKTLSGNAYGYYVSDGKIANAQQNETYVMRHIQGATYYMKHTEGNGGGRFFSIAEETYGIGTIAYPMSTDVIINKDNVVSYTPPDDAKWVFFLYGRRDSQSTRSFAEQADDTMITIDVMTSETPYEPYHAPTTTNIFLSEPLRKVGSYSDTVSVRGTNVTVVRNVGSKILDGSESWSIAQVNNCYSTEQNNLVGTNETSRLLLCTHFKSTNTVPVSTGRQGYCFKGHNEGQSYISIGANEQYPTSDDWNNYLATRYANGNPVIVLYPLATPVSEITSIENTINALDTTSIVNIDTVTAPSEVYCSEWVEQ